MSIGMVRAARKPCLLPGTTFQPILDQLVVSSDVEPLKYFTKEYK